MTRSLLSLPPLVIAALLAGLPASGQDVPVPPTPPLCAPESVQDEDDGSCDEACDARTLSHLDGVGASTSLSVVRQGDAWHIELERVTLADAQGAASEQSLDVYVKSTRAVDQGLEALFRDAPDDPAEWERRLEAITRIDIDLVQPDPALTAPLFEPRRSRPERWFEELRARWEAWERRFSDEVRRWRHEDDGCYHGGCERRRDLDRDGPRQGRLYY